MKNIIIAILVIALCISGYFNYQFKQDDSKTFKIYPEKDALEITFYGNKKIKDSSLSQPKPDPKPLPNSPDFAKLVLAGTITVKFQNGAGSVCPPGQTCVEPPPGGTSVNPPEFFSIYENLAVRSLRIVPRDFRNVR